MCLGMLVEYFLRIFFFPGLIVSYWMTNIVGLVLLHKSASNLFSNTENKYTMKNVVKDLFISILYTGVIVMLFKFRILRFDYKNN